MARWCDGEVVCCLHVHASRIYMLMFLLLIVYVQHQFLVQVTRKMKLSTRMLEEVAEQPEERFDLHDGDPFQEYGSLPPEETERCPLEQNRLRDMQSCAHRIRGNWAQNIDVQTVSSNDAPREDEDDEDDKDHEDDIEVT